MQTTPIQKPQPEKLLQPKEISAAFKDQLGIVVSESFVRAMLRAGVRRMGYNARFSDVVVWWESNPDFSPRAKQKEAE